jgi:hypothetical protein
MKSIAIIDRRAWRPSRADGASRERLDVSTFSKLRRLGLSVQL